MMEVTSMSKASSARWLVLSIASAALLSACDAGSPCAIPGTAEACACALGAQGARVCDAEHTWGECNCSGAIPLPNPIMELGGMGGSGGRAGVGGTAGVGGAGVGGMAGNTPPTDGGSVDDDGGVEPDGGGMGGMSGGMGGASGAGGMEPNEPYGPCMTNDDCAPIGDCTITPNYPADATVCAPRCTATSDCPVPAGMYDAVIMCVTGYCRIDCTSVAFEPLLSCPTGMTCIAPLFGTPWCHDDGM